MWIGADPGGHKNFGIAILHEDGRFTTCCVSHADEAVEKAVKIVGRATPLGAGIDAPMWWSSGPSSDRKADQWIRKHYGVAAGTVQTANSLRGAVLVQGVLFAERLRQRFPGVGITEAHPKALLLALKWKWAQFRDQYKLRGEPASDHERDAVIGAVAAREGFTGRWPRDLAEDRLPSEQDPASYWLAPMRYFWPE